MTIEVDKVHEFEGCFPIFWIARGHHDPDAFKAAIREQWDEDPDEGQDDPAGVIHQYMRFVPVGSMKGASLYVDARGPGRGAFPVTLIYI